VCNDVDRQLGYRKNLSSFHSSKRLQKQSMSQVYVQPVSPVVVQQPMVTTQTVVQQPQQREMKSIAVAYVLWWFFVRFFMHI
jgi:hypothetical protein